MTARQTHSTDRTDLIGGIALGIAALGALGMSNSALVHYYDALVHVTAEIRIGSFNLSKSLEHWINDGLMAIFFLLIGLEIKREVIEGSLASVQKTVLPVIAAIGGSRRRQSTVRSTGQTLKVWRAGLFRQPLISPLWSEFALC